MQHIQSNIDVNAAQTLQKEILESHYLLQENFLCHSENQQLLNYALQERASFLPTEVSNYSSKNRVDFDENRYCPLVLQSFPEFETLIVKKIQEILPIIFVKLNIPGFSISEFENRLTAYNHGNFYGVHIDNKHPGIDTRMITYVYYFYQEPKAFTGGNLRIYDSKIQGNYYSKADTSKTIEPKNNSIVFFLSSYLHEVLPMSCPSQNFVDSRFTVNGWMHCTKTP